ncbi:uncharacterized protein LOC119658420 [Hermetia illucens]|uniref:uncharacterized protein LOC119658420 n=1 Tax=Hermetia illucens TaxID=343691 RepID=UPI0018CC0DB2|nr:uncharacterized protein LOC119658420 [Hermetia illucens]
MLGSLVLFLFAIVPVMGYDLRIASLNFTPNPSYLLLNYSLRHHKYLGYNVTLLKPIPGIIVSSKIVYIQNNRSGIIFQKRVDVCKLIKGKISNPIINAVLLGIIRLANTKSLECSLCPGSYYGENYHIPSENLPLHMLYRQNISYETKTTFNGIFPPKKEVQILDIMSVFTIVKGRND